MRTLKFVSRILWCEVIGFLAIIVLSWSDELTDLPHFIGGVQYVPNCRESALETLIVLLVAIPVIILTKRLVSRLYYLEGLAHLRLVQEAGAQWRVDSAGRVLRAQVPNGDFPRDMLSLYG